MAELSEDAMKRAREVEFVLLDVDGVLTDGRLYMDSAGGDARAFHARDGLGVRLGQRGGLLFGILSGRESKVVTDRAEELYITEVHQRVFNKEEKLAEILRRLKLEPRQVCYMGDDLVDLPVFRRVGFTAAPADATPEVVEFVDLVTTRRGGDGAVRELIDFLLRAKGKWDAVTSRFFRNDA